MLVLDTSAILSFRIDADNAITTEGVIKEIKKGGASWRRLQYMLARGMKVVSPPDDCVEKVKEIAKLTGDYKNLSEVDIEVIALALHTGGTIVTDDYSIQNVAKELKLKYQGVLQEEIDKKIKWRWRCRSCGKYYDSYYEECPVCGGKLKRVAYDRD